MSLTTGRAPFSTDPAGRFDVPMRATVYVEPFLRRVRAFIGERTVLDSERVVLIHRTGQPPTYAFPEADARELPASPEPAVQGYVRVPWDAATAWYEEEEQVFGGHPRNPYHRIDCVRAQRRLRVEVATLLLVDTSDVICLYETSRAPQLYVARAAVRMELLVASKTTSYCPYKGTASYWSARLPGTDGTDGTDGAVVPDVAWSYNEPLPESTPIAGMLSFYAERTTMIQETLTWFAAPQGRTYG